jgi:hypothetical protein
MIDNRTQVFDVAMKNARTIEACVDRLYKIHALIGEDVEGVGRHPPASGQKRT